MTTTAPSRPARASVAERALAEMRAALAEQAATLDAGERRTRALLERYLRTTG